MKSSLCLLLFLATCVCVLGATWKPMSPCKVARATWYPIGRNSSGAPQGTCGFGPVMDDMNPVFKNGYLSAPDDETYNAALKYITNGGLGWSCGECYEVVGAKGTIYILAADICDFGAQSNCGGLQNKDHQDFNIDKTVWSKIYTDTAGGSTTINVRKVSCDHGTRNVSFFFSNDGEPNLYWWQIRFYNYRVGIRGAQVLQNGVWKDLVRGWTNTFTWQDSGAIVSPFRIRVKSIYGSWITFAQNFTSASIVKGKRYKSSFQFPLPADGFGNSTAASCKWAGPQPVIYGDALGSLAKIAWKDWGSWSTTVNYAATTGCYLGKCIVASGFNSASGLQIGNPNSFAKTFFAYFNFRAKVSSGTAKLNIVWDCNGVSSTTYNLPTSINTTWQLFSIKTSNWTISNNCFKVVKFIGGSTAATNLYLDIISLSGAAAGTGPMTGWTQCSTFTTGTTCNSKFWCLWKGTYCVNNVT